MNSLLKALSKAPWLLRQITKASAYIMGIAAAGLAKLKFTAGGVDIDLLSVDQEAVIVLAAGALTAGIAEAVLSYARNKFSEPVEG